MKTLSTRYQSSVSTLLAAYQTGTLGHGGEGNCAITHLLDGQRDWMDVINPASGHIDHWNKYNHPRQFAKGLQLINNSPFSVQEIIKLEALFEGRVKDPQGHLISTLDEDNDPDATLGLGAVITGLEEIEFAQELSPIVLQFPEAEMV
ncbi:MAG: hypothetical protein AAF587_18865 [Bacteroidota bacterium]